ncbi:MAG: hypothetical protein EOO50_05065 [Flavobacterium sp.]|uniref:hypothetical protein n=1 Tax=Flavobacterium sp. TaxID=239 RepID=UPI00120FD136|nr:hypothetical protein [Flavobacterium sp.]RZJ67654.1 MAG: hypothetical protein EOO50_05065 [Flavobacterium sp.]
MIGDVKNGLEKINVAETKRDTKQEDIKFVKAVLLTMNGQYQESLDYYESVKSTFSKIGHFNGNYALSLYEVASRTNDEKLMKKAKKQYAKVKNKGELTDDIRSKFEKI